jgi:two-component system, cell cycle sensor histidine kinase and response regulator CckA
MPLTTKAKPESAWTPYAFAVIVCCVVFALRFELEHRAGIAISFQTCGLAAVISCSWLAGFGSAITATTLTTIWYVSASPFTGSTEFRVWIHYLLYATEAVAVCLYGRQLRLAKDRAAKGEDWQRHLVETAGEGIWMISPDGVIGYANPRMAEILGCLADEITGQRLNDFLFPEDLPMERIRLQNIRIGVRDQWDRRLRRPDGTEVWVLACSSLYESRQSNAVVLTMMTDITERKKAEQALRRSERRYRELFENILEGVYQTSPDGRILAANPELLRMLGFSSQEELSVPGVVRDTFVEPGLHLSLRERLERDGSYANVEFQLRTRDQRVITVRENARVVRDENGDVLYYEGTLTDITEQIRFEEQLHQAQNMEALGRLAGGIARDFRAIGVGMANSLQQTLEVLPADSPARTGLDAVTRSMHSASALTRQILDFSQRQTIHPDSALIDVNDFVTRLEPALIRLANPENSLTLSLSERPTPVTVDPGHLEHVISSFVSHAGEFGSGAKRIVLSTTIEATGPVETVGPFVSLSVCCHVADTSSQDPELRPWIGMATTRAILAQYGGMMSAAIEAPSCVRYSLYLPLASGTLPTPKPDAEPVATVLLVEEEPLIRELSRDMLERQGFRVLTAGNATEAERIARGQDTFDVLITVWPTDGVAGNALVQLLRGMRPDLRVLFVAGYSDGSADSISPPDGSVILQKPFSGDSLGRKIRLLLERADTAEL